MSQQQQKIANYAIAYWRWQTLNPDAITHPDLQIGWEKLLGEPVNLGSEQNA